MKILIINSLNHIRSNYNDKMSFYNYYLIILYVILFFELKCRILHKCFSEIVNNNKNLIIN